MFPGSQQAVRNAAVITLATPANIALRADDPDHIVLEVSNLAFSGAAIYLPNNARVGKEFNFSMIVAPAAALSVFTTQYAEIIVPTPNGLGSPVNWRIFVGGRPRFIYTPRGWQVDAASGNMFAFGATRGAYSLSIGNYANANDEGVSLGWNTQSYTKGVATGAYANANTNGSAVGHTALAYSNGAALGKSADGNTDGAAVGASANGSSSGSAVGKNANGSSSGAAHGNAANGSTNGAAMGSSANGSTNGAALGYSANTNNKDAAVALAYNSKAQRYREIVKAGDGAATNLQLWSTIHWYGTTTNATPTEILLGGTAAQYCVLLNNSAIMFDMQIIAGVTGAGNTSSWTIRGAIKRGANAASTVLVGTPTVTVTGQDAGAAAWAVAVTADTTNGSLKLSVTGQASTTIKWNAIATLSELRF